MKLQRFAFFPLGIWYAELARWFFKGGKGIFEPEFRGDTFIDIWCMRHVVGDHDDLMPGTRTPFDFGIGCRLIQGATVGFRPVAPEMLYLGAGQFGDRIFDLAFFSGQRLIEPPRFFMVFFVFRFRECGLEFSELIARNIFHVRHAKLDVGETFLRVGYQRLDFCFRFFENFAHRAARIEDEHDVCLFRHRGACTRGCCRHEDRQRERRRSDQYEEPSWTAHSQTLPACAHVVDASN